MNNSKPNERILTNDKYRNRLESIIQRDYFPPPLVNAADDVATSTSFAVPNVSESSASSLDEFHRSVISEQMARFRKRLQQEQQKQSERNRFLYNQNHQRNALFFPVETTKQEQQSEESIITTSTRDDEESKFQIPLVTHTMQKRIHSLQQRQRLVPKTIEPKATRFPTPEQYRILPGKHYNQQHHWENDSDDDDDDTNLDASVVHSIASEIRQGKERRQLQQQQSSNTHPFPEKESGYPFPPVCLQELVGEELLLQPECPPPATASRSKHNHHHSLPQQPLPVVFHTNVSKSGQTTIKPSVRSKNSLRLALRSSYQKRKKAKLKEIV